jgi:hypothetical protein
MTSTRALVVARAAARLMTVVVLPTPPFWFATHIAFIADLRFGTTVRDGVVSFDPLHD